MDGLRTGDVGVIDDDGYLSIIDRKKELIINSGGKNMSPLAIEAVPKTQRRRAPARRPPWSRAVSPPDTGVHPGFTPASGGFPPAWRRGVVRR